MLAPRHLPRLAATIGLFTRYGLADFARDQGLSALGQADEKSSETNGADIEANARAFRERLVELGPAYIKLGQLLATRSDLLPPPYISELSTLNDDVEPLPFPEVASIIEAELGASVDDLFHVINTEPLGTASLGQAHAATLPDGRDVVIKVQRPNIRALLADDIDFFKELATFLTSTPRRGSGSTCWASCDSSSARLPMNSITASRHGTAHSSAGAWRRFRDCSFRASSSPTPLREC
jgi:predicted unusual protein kinase regulating ubiquinone biosynthesis (AarF/ABC1/UbiB family)